jgi:hypothetical protein
MKLKNMSERSQTQKNKYCTLLLIEISRIDEFPEVTSCQKWGRQECGVVN